MLIDVDKELAKKKLQDAGCSEAFIQEILKLQGKAEFSALVSLHIDAQANEGTWASQQFSAFFGKRLPTTQLPAAFRSLVGGIAQALGFGSFFNAQDELPMRPPEEHLLEGLSAFTKAIDFYRSPIRKNKMVNVTADPEELKQLYLQIDLGRHLLRISMRFTETILANLTLTENRAYKVLKGSYELVRSVALIDEEMNDLLADTEKCLYGAAQKAAERRRDNEDRATKVQDETEKKLKLAGEGDKRNLVGGDLLSFFDVMRRLIGSPTGDDRTAAR